MSEDEEEKESTDRAESIGCGLILAAIALSVAAPTIIEIIKAVQGR